MNSMNDSGIEWIGIIPDNWDVKIIKNICKLKGRIGWQGLTSDEYIDDGPFLITGVDFSDGNINWDSCEHVSEWRYSQAPEIQIKDDDLLITKDGTVGKVALVKNSPDKVTLNSGVLLMRPISDFYIEKFLYYVLLSEEFWHWFEVTNLGNTTILHLYQNVFAKFKLTVPPVTEQQLIVDFLDEKVEKIDEILYDLQKQVEILQKYKKSVITKAITKGIDFSVTMKDSGIDWVGEIPQKWKISKLKYMVEIKDGTHDTPDYIEPGEDTVPLITGRFLDYNKNIILYDEANHISYCDYKKINIRSNVEYNDIIMPMIGTIGNPVIVKEERPFSIKNVALFKTSDDEILAKYLYYQLNSNVIEEQFNILIRGGVQSFVSLNIIGNLITINVEKKTQQEIVSYLDNKCREIEKIILGKQKQIENMEKYKKSLIYEYVTGKKRVKGAEELYG